MLAADGPIGADDRGLHVAQGGIDPFEGRFIDRRHATAGFYRLVSAAGISDAGKSNGARR